MKKVLKRILYALLSIISAIIIFGLILAFLPSELKQHHVGITPGEAESQRQIFKGSHELFKTTDGVTLFLRRWNPDTIVPAKKDIAVLLFHGITAHSGAYDMAGVPISAGGYTTFGLDYRGHGLSDGNRGEDVKQLRLPANLDIPVLVGIGDKDELFDVDKVKELYDIIPGNKKEFLVMKNATHAKIPVECWEEIVIWLNKNF
jgi:alpha-beta hydrolase superfamily lysophospholipase